MTKMVYIMRMRECNCLVGAAIDDPKRPDAAKHFLEDAATNVVATYIERTTLEFVQNRGLQTCNHHKSKDKEEDGQKI